MAFRVGFDVGGTFTDFALQRDDGALFTGKRLTTPHDPAQACIEGLREIIARASLSWPELGQAVHATTLGSNIVIERKGRNVALLTTRGFRDVLIIGREKRYQVYDLFIDKAEPLIPRNLIREVTERTLYDGTIEKPLDEDELRATVRDLVREGVSTVAVVFLHSYVNPDHERRAAEIIAVEAPQLSVTLSSDVSPIFREYERTSTTVVNAYVKTAIEEYLGRLEHNLSDLGYQGKLFIMQSSGGIATAETMRRFPVRMIESGPAAGALMATVYGRITGNPNLVSFDMGGTTAKLSLISELKPHTAAEFELNKVRLQTGSGIPMSIEAIDLVEIGAGGGSIARVNTGVLTVGPDSAGSDPGPICYGIGGVEPCVTDANAVLGYLNPDYFLGGRMTLNLEGARQGIEERVAQPLGISLAEAAWGIHQIVNSNMELATRVVSIERGHDPRLLSFVAFGGSGPVHGVRLAQALGIPTAILPASAGVTSAIGLLAAEVKFDAARTYVTRVAQASAEHLNTVYDEMEQSGREVIREAGITGKLAITRTAEMRYVGQGYELNVPVPAGALTQDDVEQLRETFNTTYAQRYGYSDRSADIELVNCRVTVVGSGPTVQMPVSSARGASAEEARKPSRPVYFPEYRDYIDCPIYDRYRLFPGARVEGPAIVEEEESTTVLPPGCVAEVDQHANLIVAVGGEAR